MSDHEPTRLQGITRILLTEGAVYGLILVSGMVVVSGAGSASAANALLTVAVTVLVFYAAHVYAGALARLALTEGHSGLRASLARSARHSAGMLLASVAPLAVLALGALGLVEDMTALWAALVVNTVLLGVLGWVAVARWSTHWTARIASAIVSAMFGGALIVLKAVITH